MYVSGTSLEGKEGLMKVDLQQNSMESEADFLGFFAWLCHLADMVLSLQRYKEECLSSS